MFDRVELSILLDYYGELLTEKQRSVMDLYYNDDLSLSEIGEINETSRQAIYDLIKRCYKQLQGYEDKLHLMKDDFEVSEKKKEVFKLLDKIDCSKTKENEILIENIKNIIKEI